jgi:hypothetical protein
VPLETVMIHSITEEAWGLFIGVNFS